MKSNVPSSPTSGGGRGVPDVAGDASPETGYNVFYDGQSAVVGGTSAVAPLWAALIALLNQQRGSNIGLANVTLYQNAENGFHDITQGNNGTYSAGSGWDACTAWAHPTETSCRRFSRLLRPAPHKLLHTEESPLTPRTSQVRIGVPQTLRAQVSILRPGFPGLRISGPFRYSHPHPLKVFGFCGAGTTAGVDPCRPAYKLRFSLRSMKQPAPASRQSKAIPVQVGCPRCSSRTPAHPKSCTIHADSKSKENIAMHKFGVWAPKARKMSLEMARPDSAHERPQQPGWWTLEVPDASCGDKYAFLLDDDPTPYPDPRGLRQPDGVHGPSELYDHSLFEWHDQLWRGAPKIGSIIYELHIGTFSKEGTFDGAIRHLQYLADLGVTHVEVMPVAAWAGHQGWGYDGVCLFATHEPYGGPDGFKRFVDACHATGLSVILDVVYNHFGPVGNYTTKFGPYLNPKRQTPWGDAVNLDEEGSDEVRRFFVDNALMWLKDYHCDGLRFDAVHAFIDLSAVHFLEQLSIEVERLSATLAKEFYLIAESDLNDPRIVRSREANGYGMDSQWSDDFHHALFTVLYDPKDGETGYYDDFGSLADLHKALKTCLCL